MSAMTVALIKGLPKSALGMWGVMSLKTATRLIIKIYKRAKMISIRVALSLGCRSPFVPLRLHFTGTILTAIIII